MTEKKKIQQDIAAAMSTTRQAVAQYCDGVVQPNIEKVYKVAKYLEVSADYLLGLTNEKSPSITYQAINQKLGLTGDAIGVLERYHAIGDNELDFEYKPTVKAVNLLLSSDYALTLLDFIYIYVTREDLPSNIQALTEWVYDYDTDKAPNKKNLSNEIVSGNDINHIAELRVHTFLRQLRRSVKENWGDKK